MRDALSGGGQYRAAAAGPNAASLRDASPVGETLLSSHASRSAMWRASGTTLCWLACLRHDAREAMN